MLDIHFMIFMAKRNISYTNPELFQITIRPSEILRGLYWAFPLHFVIEGRTAGHLILLASHLPGILTVLFKIRSEIDVLTRNRILADVGQESKSQKDIEYTVRSSRKKKGLTTPHTVDASRSILL